MLQKLSIHGVHMTLDNSLQKYATKKLGNLDKYIPKTNREAARGEVILKEDYAKDNNSCVCEVNLTLPQHQIVVKEKALNMYAAIDIAEAKLKLQLKKYKDLHCSAKTRRHIMSRLINREA